MLVFLGDEAIRGHVLVVGATNHPEWLDPALKRFGRFDVIFPVLCPEASARRSMLQVQARLQAVTMTEEALTLMAQETEKYSAADLEALLKEARFQAQLQGGRSIGLHEAREALSNIRPVTLSSVEAFTRHALEACNNLRYLPAPVAAQERERRRRVAERKVAEESAAPLVSTTRSARGR
jgi:SpoVK/Ycf46/Vps4 family AAA+-type ATPase